MKLNEVCVKATENVPEMKITPAEDTKSNGGSSYGIFESQDPIVPTSKKKVEAAPGGGHGHHGVSSGHKNSYLETSMHLYKSNVGSGIFALGDAFKNAGLFLALPLTVSLGVICIHAQYILLNCSAEVSKRLSNSLVAPPDYATTVEQCFATGPLQVRKYALLMRKLVNTFLCITQLGFCCVCVVFVSTNMQQVLSVWGINIKIFYLMAIVMIPILLSSWIRNLKYLVPLSSFGNILVTYGYVATIYVIVSKDLPPVSDRKYVADFDRLPLYFGTAIFCFEGIGLVLPLKNEMKKPQNFSKPLGVLNVGMCIVGSMFLVIGFLSYLRYGEGVRGSVTLNLEPLSDILPLSIRLAISLSNTLGYALQFYVPVSLTWPSLQERFGPFSWPVTVEILFRTAICMVTYILAAAIPRLDLFISLIGAVSSTALALFFPLAIDFVMRWQDGTLGAFVVIKNVLILLIGITGCVSGTWGSVNEIIKYFRKST